MNSRTGTLHASWILAAAIGLALGLGACAAVPAQQEGAGAAPQSAGAQASSDQPEHHCNTAAAAVIGGLLGALAGKGKGHLVGAAAGAGIGALICTAYNYHVRKLRDAQQMNSAYVQQYGMLPAANTVASYTSSLQPSSTVQAGGNVSMQSTIGVVAGTHAAPPRISEKLTLIGPDGKTLSSATKDATAITSGGEYQTNFDFNLPKGIKDGQYTVQTEVLMDGEPVRTNQTPMLVVG